MQARCPPPPVGYNLCFIEIKIFTFSKYLSLSVERGKERGRGREGEGNKQAGAFALPNQS